SSFYFESPTDNHEEPPEIAGTDRSRKKVILTPSKNRKRYQIYNSDTLYNVDYLGVTKVLVSEAMPKIDWHLEQETKKIEKFTCHKATAVFRGRSYIAWFTTEIPVQLGPWKFNGLPGAVLQIYDESKSFTWTAKQVKVKASSPEKKPDHDLEEFTLKEFVTRNEKEQGKLIDESILKFAGRGYKE